MNTRLRSKGQKPDDAARRFAIFGTGRVGRNMAAYLRSLGHETTAITRSDATGDPARARVLASEADVVAVAIPDDKLAAWARDWRGAFEGKPVIHFSGAILVDGMMSYHPLYSFPRGELSPATMRMIALARQEGSPSFADLAPGAPNPEFVVADADRAYYHALAVLSGNFAAFLWNETARGFAGRLAIEPETMLASYLSGVVERFRESPFDSLTGPVARRDQATVEANLKALQGEPKLASLYRSFLEAAWPAFERKDS